MIDVRIIQCVGPDEAKAVSKELQCKNIPIKNYVVVSSNAIKTHSVEVIVVSHNARASEASFEDHKKYNEVA